ncbi:DUF1801 domain-containing protein [Caulobacter sp. SLTY]|uniref:DUF1801 domain-containing protein n=1 Tax=Caulobacter sp. SLTY TaxID=2683262 RepID=UPI0014125AC2|nr:DUF1801 domain-containing protein [Caulobacter sp. SLTY]NBB17405.1 DUF1801 domain-containing protein [Caulobacter sp. SLTY]
MGRKISSRPPLKSEDGKPILLSGGNPQIAKGYGNVPVQAYLDAVPGWKQGVCRKVDALVERIVPGVAKAVKWNSPFYGVEEGSWFLSFHCFDKYVKLTFFRGTSMEPLPPGASKVPEVRYLDIRENDPIGEELENWIRQASKLPGERL